MYSGPVSRLIHQSTRKLDRQIASLARRAAPQRHRLLVACFPKSGSTYLSTVLASLPGFDRAVLSDASEHCEQELSRFRLANAAFGPAYVAQHHTRHHAATAALMRKFGVRPVVLVRDIFDCMVSLRDHVRTVSPNFPMARTSLDMSGWPDRELTDFLIDMAGPWYIDFFVSWTGCRDAAWVTYDDFVTDPAGVTGRLAGNLGIDCTRRDIDRAIAAAGKAPTLRNRAIPGRGACLTDAQRHRIIRQTGYYPDTDFTLMGVPARMRRHGPAGDPIVLRPPVSPLARPVVSGFADIAAAAPIR